MLIRPAVLTAALVLAVGAFVTPAIRGAVHADAPAEGAYALLRPAARKAAPGFSLTDLSGRKIDLAQDRGQVVLLDFWAVDCGGCKIEVPWYVDFDRRYRSQGLAVIGVDMYGEAPAKIRPFMARAHMDYPVAVGNDAIGQRFGVTEMPLTLLIDRKGRVAIAHAGIVDRAQFEDDIRALLAEKR
ncbi:MAG TPA: TlpA disulfide reductase family protein [Acidobacteriaceae bacterium]|jgi:cytochrome c biogenesis protein CcmG/thiol:disulfide interchange protein DsbE|nr:TlpA disulfide reductase family protein [Acidobacteriaceae bacterium]